MEIFLGPGLAGGLRAPDGDAFEGVFWSLRRVILRRDLYPLQ